MNKIEDGIIFCCEDLCNFVKDENLLKDFRIMRTSKSNQNLSVYGGDGGFKWYDFKYCPFCGKTI